MMMGLSYSNIICHLKMLKQERRRLTNSEKCSTDQKDKKERVTIQELKSPEHFQVTYSNSSEEAEKEICKTLTSEMPSKKENAHDIPSISLMVVDHQTDRKRRFSEFDAVQKVHIFQVICCVYHITRKPLNCNSRI